MLPEAHLPELHLPEPHLPEPRLSLPREPVYLAGMPRLRHLAVLFAFLNAFARPAPASAFTPASLETRVGGFEVAARLLVGELGAASRDTHQGIGAAYDENASGYRFAAGGADRAAPSIARIAPGSLPVAEEASLLRTLGHIDAGTTPTGSLATKWGTRFKNWAGDLPGARGAASPYLEYRVAPQAGTSGAGPLRVVTNPQTGEMYYTWTHYGDTAAPAFVQIR